MILKINCVRLNKSREDQSPPYTNNPKSQALTTPECGDQEFWFYKGKDLKTKQEFDKQLCSDNLEIERQKGENGEKTIQGCGDKTYYFCDYKIKESEKDYKECSCDVEKYDKSKEGKMELSQLQQKGPRMRKLLDMRCGCYR